MEYEKLSKEEFLKFLNCETPPQTITYLEDTDKERKIFKKFGKFKACNLRVNETSLNNKVARIPLPRVDLRELSIRKVRSLFAKKNKARKSHKKSISRFGRQIKNKRFFENTNKRKSKYLISPAARTLMENSTYNGELRKSTRMKTINYNENSNGALKNVKTPKTKPNATPNKISTPQSIGRVQKPTRKLLKPSNLQYALRFSENFTPKNGKLLYSFEKLVTDIKHLTLPSPDWKIKVIVKSNKISSIVFTNKCVLERSVTFSVANDHFFVMIDNKSAVLLGAPKGVTCKKDIEVLLNIVQNISSKNAMVCFN